MKVGEVIQPVDFMKKSKSKVMFVLLGRQILTKLSTFGAIADITNSVKCQAGRLRGLNVVGVELRLFP